MKKLIHLNIDEVCGEHSLSHDTIRKFITEEWITPFDLELLLFDHEDLARVALICELQEDLGVNDESVLIILNLIDQVNFLRTNINANKERL